MRIERVPIYFHPFRYKTVSYSCYSQYTRLQIGTRDPFGDLTFCFRCLNERKLKTLLTFELDPFRIQKDKWDYR